MSAGTARPALGHKIPGFVNILGALLLLVVIATLALRDQSATPPSIAEFAPQAQQIKSAPSEQTSKFGNGANGAGNGAFVPSPSPSPPPPGVPQGAVISSCVGDPPRQIEDPQSPPCVPYWVGHNGGATSKGVSANQITVVTTQTCKCDDMRQMVTFLNKRFELYGRQIVLQYDSDQGTSPAQQRATADSESQNIQPFAATNSNDGGGIDYADQLAHDGVISTFVRPYLPESYLSAHRPYIWSYPMAFDTLERTYATWICDRLKGGNAVHAGAALAGKPRVYGLVFTTEAVDIPISPQLLKDSLASCGVQLAVVATPQNQTAGTGQGTANDAAVVTQLSSAHVTTVICLCEHSDLQAMGQAADQQIYFPEWVTTTYILNDQNVAEIKQGPPPDQLAHLFGLTVLPMQRLFQDHPSTWADPSTPYASDLIEDVRDYEYHNLLLIASGIQMAGPNLTPTNFEAGLQKAAFPNPDTGIHAGHVGFGGGSHAMTVDAAEFWWSNTEHGPYADEGAGTFCYVDHGARHSLADPWPAGDPFFTGACDSGSQSGGGG